MEIKDIILIMFSALGLFLLIGGGAANIVAILTVGLGFFVIFISRFIHFLFIQYNRLTKQTHTVISKITVVAVFFPLLGMIIGQYQLPSTFMDFLPFGTHLLLAVSTVICIFVGVQVALLPCETQ